MQQKENNDRRLIQSIQRAGDILSLFIEEKSILGISDFAQKLSLPKTTIQGIVNTLAELHYLEQDPLTSKYRLGARLFQLGMSYATNMDMLTITRVWLERLCFQFREPVNIGMLVGKRVIILLRAEPETRFTSFPQAGSVIPAHTTCIGKLLFAFMTEERRNEVLAGYNFEALTPNSITDRETFLRELEQVRKEGISYDREENFAGMAGIGGPIYNHRGQVIAAFAVTGDAGHLREEHDAIVNEVRATSREISNQFGLK